MEKISVGVRFRPSTSSPHSDSSHQWQISDNAISLCHLNTPISGYTFAFDHVFDESLGNAVVYRVLIKSIIDAAIDGFNGTAFAYGQTSSGKTYTMNGSEMDPGIIPLAIKDIFDTIHKTSEREFLIRVSYMEIYNEEINDLLVLESQKLPIHENLERGVYVAGIREEIVSNAEQVLQLLKLGEENRHFGETNMNARSSRSHTIFRMVIESRAKEEDSFKEDTITDAVRVSVLNLVDLAGSERIAKTGAEGVRLKEGKHINKSLMVLGNVINKLSEGGKQRGHIPYRDSKLTRILQPALGGNAKTSIICTVAPEDVHVEETRGTLQFASRAKRITNCVQVNEILTDAALLKRQKLEIEELRKKLMGSHSEVLEQVLLKQRNDMHKSELERDRLATELEEERKARYALEHRILEQEKKIENIMNLSVSAHFSSACSQKKVGERSATPDEAHFLAFDHIKTPNFKCPSIDFVVRRPSYKELESSPIPDNFADVADEDLWTRLNKGCVTDLEAFQMTPPLPVQEFPSSETSLVVPSNEELQAKNYERLEEDLHDVRKQCEALKEQYSKLEEENNILKEEKIGLTDDVACLENEINQVKSEKQVVLKELKEEKRKLNDLREEVRRLITTFSQKEGMLTSLYSKSRAFVENTKTAPIAPHE
ncbi:Kinesin-like protein [Rhynchospora pubera]|uniref:Kinesin-like protein n=1 Tax=Rhynchospora pubera TaxID=906938 RepID=A0AAV8CNB1_9POAL|nr:Kinesin-like protein [Rhynchospora pubera]